MDSDYDVRLVYLHPEDWYLSIDVERKRDVIDRPIDGQLDVSGWDVRKALRLLRKGNPPLIEWLGSPIVYKDSYAVADRMRDLLSRYHSPVASMYHYLNMARGNYRDYLKGNTVWVKKYLYVLRPLLAIRYLERGLGIVPTDFQALVDRAVESPELKGSIERLVAAKRSGRELDRGPRVGTISDFIENELARLEGAQFGHEYVGQAGPVAAYDRVFRAALADVWS